MTWLLLERDKHTRDVLLPDEIVVRQTQKQGLSCCRTRDVFDENYGKLGPNFRLISLDGRSLVDTPEDIPDLLIWSWLPIFSSRAVDALSSILEDDDFIPCKIEGAKQKNCFIHLPRESAEGLIVERSRFKSFVPMNPPIPIGPIEIVLDPRATWNRNIVRVAVPLTGQVLSDLFVSDIFGNEWFRHGLLGAIFKEISLSWASLS
jgi:hypothetical protein